MFMTFNDNSSNRKSYYQALSAVLDITLSNEHNIDDYMTNLTRMFGNDTIANAVGTVTGDVRFFGLTQTNLNLAGLDKHIKLIESYQKLQAAKRNFHHT